MRLRACMIALSVLALAQACSPATTITNTPWVASPDGQWLTRITRYDTAGPGIDGLYETVQLKRRSASQEVEVFTLDEGALDASQLRGPPIITMRWNDTHHLEIKFRAGEAVHHFSRVTDVFVSVGS